MLDTFFEILSEAKELEIEIINFGKMNPINNLKKLYRTGKKIRLEQLKRRNIKVRTIYDHINSVAYMADLFIKENIFSCDEYKLSSMIVYHDLCEVLIIDYPRHTKNYAVESKSISNVLKVDKTLREDAAMKFIWLFANDKQKSQIDILNEDNEEQDILWLLDKIDPIINTWRYMYVYNKEIKKSKFDYVDIMDDFFTNPVLNKIVDECKYEVIKEMINYLKSSDNARSYLNDKIIDKNNILSSKAKKIVKHLIEEVPLIYK